MTPCCGWTTCFEIRTQCARVAGRGPAQECAHRHLDTPKMFGLLNKFPSVRNSLRSTVQRFTQRLISSGTTRLSDKTSGRVVDTQYSNPVQAYLKLKTILNQNKVQATWRLQKEFEKPHDKRRRFKQEKAHRTFLRFLKSRVRLAHNMHRRAIQEETKLPL